MDSRLLGLILVFAPLSLVSFGGGQAIIADMQHQTVDVQQWMSGPAFADLFALSRAAPGPSTLIAALIGWQVAGLLGAITATLAIYVPSSVVVYAATRWWHARRDSPWRGILERGLRPIAVGLVFAAALSVMQSAHAGLLEIGTAAAACLCLLYTEISAYVLMAIAAAVFAVVQFLQ